MVIKINTWKNVSYRPSEDTVLVSSFKLETCRLEDEAVSDKGFQQTKAGCFGMGRQTFSLLSIRNTDDIVGRSLGSSCTHNKPTCMHFITLDVLQESLSVWLTISNCLSSFHNFQA